MTKTIEVARVCGLFCFRRAMHDRPAHEGAMGSASLISLASHGQRRTRSAAPCFIRGYLHKKPASPCEDAGLMNGGLAVRRPLFLGALRRSPHHDSVTGDSGGFGLLGFLVAEPGAAWIPLMFLPPGPISSPMRSGRAQPLPKTCATTPTIPVSHRMNRLASCLPKGVPLI